jgi:hypothetical protein
MKSENFTCFLQEFVTLNHRIRSKIGLLMLFRLCIEMNADPLRWTKVGLGKSREKRIYGDFV